MAATVAGWIAYAADRGDVVADDTPSAAALVRAQDYILHTYIRKFSAGYDADSDYVDEATYIAAGLELATPGFFTKTFTPDQQKILTEVKGIKWTATGKAKGSKGASPVSTAIDYMIGGYRRIGVGGFVV